MTSFMPDHERQFVELCMSGCGIISVGPKYEEHLSDALDDDLLTNFTEFPSSSKPKIRRKPCLAMLKL